MADLYIDDADFEPYNTKLAEIDVALETKLADIIALVEKASTGVEAGDFHDNLTTYATQLATMQGLLNEFTSKMQTDAVDFLTLMRQKDEESVI